MSSNNLEKLLEDNDYIGWIPNIKSDLSYSTINNFSKMNTFNNFSIIGYADKFIANLPFSDNVDEPSRTFSRLIVCTGFGDIHDILDINNQKAKFTRYFLYLKKDITTNHLMGKILFTHTNHEEPSEDELTLLNYFQEIKNISDKYEKQINNFKPYQELSDTMNSNADRIENLENNIKDKFNDLEQYSLLENSYLKSDEEQPFNRVHFLVNVHILKSGITFMKLNNDDLDLIEAFHGNSKYYHHTPRHYKIILSLLKEIFHSHSFHGSTEDSIMGCTTIKKGKESHQDKVIRIIKHQFNFLYNNILYSGFKNNQEKTQYQIKKLIGRCHYQHSLVSSFCKDSFIDDNDINIKNLKNTIDLSKNALLSKMSLLPNMFSLFMLRLIFVSSVAYSFFLLILSIDLIDTDNLSRAQVMIFLTTIIFPFMLYRHSSKSSPLSKLSLWLTSKIFNYKYLKKENDKFIYTKPYFKYPWLWTIKALLFYRKTRLISLVIISFLGLLIFYYILAPHIYNAFNNMVG